MAYHHHHEPAVVERTTYVEDDSFSGALIAVLAIVVILFLIWAIFFSGWVMDRNPEPTTTNIERTEEGDTTINVPQPRDTTGDNSGGTTGETPPSGSTASPAP
ncbi:MAG: hypothetical protein ACRD1T_03330 [Acidimicrobiia bacterium]